MWIEWVIDGRYRLVYNWWKQRTRMWMMRMGMHQLLKYDWYDAWNIYSHESEKRQMRKQTAGKISVEIQQDQISFLMLDQLSQIRYVVVASPVPVILYSYPVLLLLLS